MLRLNYLIGITLSTSVFFILTFIYKPLILSICIKNDTQLVGSTSNYSLDIPTLLFCITILALFFLLAKTKDTFKNYLSSLVLLMTLIIAALFLQTLLVDYSTNYRIDRQIANQVFVDYRLFYLLPTIFITPIILKQIFIIANGISIIYKHRLLSHLNLDIRILRFISKLTDFVIIILVAFLFSKIIVVYPDLPMMTLFLVYFYQFTLEYATETTIGKLIFGLKVINVKNKKISVYRILLRTIGRLIPFYPIGILFNKAGIHDYISGTRVIKIKTI